MKLATTAPDEDGPVWMVNLMKYKEVTEYADGRKSAVSGREADDIYAPVDVLSDIGAQIVFVADVDQQLLGDSPIWDRVAVVKYPTRRRSSRCRHVPTSRTSTPTRTPVWSSRS